MVTTSKILHPDDVVSKKSNPSHFGTIERTHGDVDTHHPQPGRTEFERINFDKEIKKPAFTKFMRDGVPPKGSVLVRWHYKEAAFLIPESKLVLVDRSLLIGDVVKKGPRDAMSGVVMNTFTTCTLQPMCDLFQSSRDTDEIPLKGLLPPTGSRQTGLRPDAATAPAALTDIPASELTYADSPMEEDLVIYKDWIGRVATGTQTIFLKLRDNGVVEINQESAQHADGAEGSEDAFNVGDIAMTKKGTLRTGRWIFGQYNPNTSPMGTVVETRTTSLDVEWLQRRIGSTSEVEPPSPLERDELESNDFRIYDRTLRPISSGNVGETISNSEVEARLGLRVRFKDIIDAFQKYEKFPRIDRRETQGYDLNVFDVIRHQTDVTVQWQDLSITREHSTDLIPDTSIDDEHAVWPSEIAHTLDLNPVPLMPGVRQPGKVGVVQTVNAEQRMANIRWAPQACVQYSVDEKDSNLSALLLGAVGLATGEKEDISLYDVEATATMNVRRGDIVLIAAQTWKLADILPTTRDVDWVGEIVDCHLDGTLTIRLGAANEVKDVNLRREDVVVAVRSDGLGGFDDAWNHEDETGTDGMMVGLNEHGQVEMYDHNSEFDSDDDSFETASEDEEAEARYEDENGDPMDEEDVEDDDWESDDQNDTEMPDASAQQNASAFEPPVPPPDASQTSHDVPIPPTPAEQLATHPDAPPAYDILSTPLPTTHPFASYPLPNTPTHLKRTTKEHRILRQPSNLPEGVYVRTWETRLDLIRVLLLGPTGTPYAHAPFIVDLHLPPNFPSEPPQAFFHSWPAPSGCGPGHGRVNPNLYEDGKICLSLLGTWEGERGEGWSAARSSVLQVLVSLLGLVLVREPYYNEAGYESVVGDEGRAEQSRIYSEGVYLKTRGFVVAAFERLGGGGGEGDGGWGGLEGLEDVVRWCYKDERGPMLLKKLVEDVEKVLRRSEGSVGEEDGAQVDGMAIMSKGACIPLRRVLERLRGL